MYEPEQYNGPNAAPAPQYSAYAHQYTDPHQYAGPPPLPYAGAPPAPVETYTSYPAPAYGAYGAPPPTQYDYHSATPAPTPQPVSWGGGEPGAYYPPSEPYQHHGQVQQRSNDYKQPLPQPLPRDYRDRDHRGHRDHRDHGRERDRDQRDYHNDRPTPSTSRTDRPPASRPLPESSAGRDRWNDYADEEDWDNEDRDDRRHDRGPDRHARTVRKRPDEMQKEDWAFFCEPCDKGFYNHAKYMDHCSEHIYCPVPGCNFLCRREYKMELHKVLLHDRNNVNLQDTEKYLEERKKRFPTREKAEKAEKIKELRRQRGEYDGRGNTRLPNAPDGGKGAKGAKGGKGGKKGGKSEPQSRPHLYYKCKKCGRSGHYTEHCQQEANPLKSFRKRSVSAEAPEESSARAPPAGVETHDDSAEPPTKKRRLNEDGEEVEVEEVVEGEAGGEAPSEPAEVPSTEKASAAEATDPSLKPLADMTEEEKKLMLTEDRRQRRLQTYKTALVKERRKKVRYENLHFIESLFLGKKTGQKKCLVQ